MRRHALAALLVLAAHGFTATSALAQAGWTGAPDVLSPRGTGETRVAADAAGHAVAVWSDLRLGLSAAMASAEYDPGTHVWSLVPSLTGANLARALAVDGVGHAIAIGLTRGAGADTNLAYRYDRVTRTWQRQPVPTQLARDARVAVPPSGEAMVCWSHPNATVHCSRYAPGAGAWSADAELDAASALGDLVTDAAGVAHAVWVSGTNVRTARFDPATGAWSAPQDLAVGLPALAVSDPRLAVNAAGNAVATWTRNEALEVSRYSPATGWSPVTVLSAAGNSSAAARAAIDPAGVITVAWTHDTPSGRSLQIARFASGSWTAPVDLSSSGATATGPAAVAADAAGSVFLLWRQSEGGRVHLIATKYTATLAQWAPIVDLSGPADDIAAPDVAVDGAGGALAVWAQDFSVRAVRWDPTPATPLVAAVSPAAGSLTLDFSVTPGTEPALSITALEYSVDGGLTWSASASTTSPLTIAGLETGATYDVRLRAANSAGAGRASGPLPVKIGADTTLHDLRVVARDGATLTLAWRPPDGVQPSNYVLQGGVAPGQTIGTLPLSGATTNVTLTLPVGGFYLRVAAAGPLGVNALSNEIRVDIETAAPPEPPAHLLGTVDGSTVQLSWTNALGAQAPTTLTVHVSGDAAGAVSLPVSETLSVDHVPPGTYTLALSASNAVGTSAPTSPITITVPAVCAAPPSPPEHVTASVVGGVVTLAWDPPHAGGAVRGYVLHVAGAFAATLPVTARVLTGAPPPGRYTVRVSAANGCGSSVPGPPVTILVP